MEREEIIEKDGAPKRYLHMKRVPLVDEQGQSLGVQVLFWDMTVFRETQDKLKHGTRTIKAKLTLKGVGNYKLQGAFTPDTKQLNIAGVAGGHRHPVLVNVTGFFTDDGITLNGGYQVVKQPPAATNLGEFSVSR